MIDIHSYLTPGHRLNTISMEIFARYVGCELQRDLLFAQLLVYVAIAGLVVLIRSR